MKYTYRMKYIKYKQKYQELKKSLNMINNINESPSKLIVNNEFLMQINNKIHIPAGDNFFDMPSYLNFLSSSKSLILDHINIWYKPFSPLILASKLILNTRRNTEEFFSCTSSKSYFEKKLDKTVLSSNQTLIWDTLKQINYKKKIEDFGTLFNN